MSSILVILPWKGRFVHAPNQTGSYQDAIKPSVLLAIWTLAWSGTLALARFGPEHLWDSTTAVSWAAVFLNLAAGLGWILTHARYLRGIDELQRKIMLDALSITLGVGWVAGFGYIVADAADLIARDAEIGVLAALLGVVYMISIAVGNLRYR
jgi:hypothetical protein